jgi:hypothetical protein
MNPPEQRGNVRPHWFSVETTSGPARRAHELALGLEDDAYPWSSLDPQRYPSELVERARATWTETAFSEYCVLTALGQTLVAFARAAVPLDLCSQVALFAAQEARHVELCARMATELGGGAPIPFSADAVSVPLSPTLTPLECANELVVGVLCVSETLSLPLLTLTMQSTTHPLCRAVLERIVRDEARHAQLGWEYLDWAKLDDPERERLAGVAARSLEHHAPGWERLKSRASDGITSEGFRLRDVHDLGWAESSAYAEEARRTVRDEILPRLARYGIAVPASAYS